MKKCIFLNDFFPAKLIIIIIIFFFFWHVKESWKNKKLYFEAYLLPSL